MKITGKNQNSLLTRFISLTIFQTLFQILKAQGGCGNPLAKLYEDVKMLGTAIEYNTSHIECVDLLDITCCDWKYHSQLAEKFNEVKETQIGFWENNFIEKANEFMTSYKDFLTWFEEKEAPLNQNKKLADIAFYENLIATIQPEKERCFEEIWKHTATMRCYVCLSNYTQFFKQLRNKTIEMEMHEDVCQLMQQVCSSYVGKYVYLVEKAKYMYQFIRVALNVPNFSDEEISTINEFDTYIQPMYNCNKTGLCRGLCTSFLSGKGYNANYTMPNVMYFDWFIDGFVTMVKVKTQEEEINGGYTKIAVETTGTQATTADANTEETPGATADPANTAGTRLLLANEFKLGVIEPTHREWRFLDQKQRRVLETAYERFKRLANSYSSVPVYSNSYKLNTIELYGKLQNLSFVDLIAPLMSRLSRLAIVAILAILLNN